jgi:methylglutaconyl-CoA hydratase
MLNLEVKNNIAFVKLDRPELHNAFNEELIEKLTNTFLKLDQDVNVRVIVLSGNGKSFCAGADLSWMKKMKDYSFENNVIDSKKLAQMFKTINSVSKPVIAKIHGAALGGGVGLVAVADFVISDEEAMFGFTEVNLGLIPAVISPFVLSKIRESYARAYFISGMKFSAQTALEMGLVHKVVKCSEMEMELDKLISTFKNGAANAQVNAKKLIFEVSKFSSLDEIEAYTTNAISKARISPEGQEGMAALLEKRKPSWIK